MANQRHPPPTPHPPFQTPSKGSPALKNTTPYDPTALGDFYKKVENLVVAPSRPDILCFSLHSIVSSLLLLLDNTPPPPPAPHITPAQPAPGQPSRAEALPFHHQSGRRIDPSSGKPPGFSCQRKSQPELSAGRIVSCQPPDIFGLQGSCRRKQR